ncbi:unnamed protein product [Allacma fusca]|uniref:L-xylulose reductase n=1 Tax=Allacma fusca TaxID=39272 RepID=A0A8J2LHF6_9HEXA|nr:unnamed protein product [Allacma fusca]
MDSEFKGKRVLVTGGARGVGEAIVRVFVDLGATVFALDREVELLSKLKESLPQIQTVAVDLRDWDATQKAVREIAPIHHLVNNAGVAGVHTLLTVGKELVDTILDINFKQVINVSQTVVNGLIETKAGGGTIVNISSVLALKPFQGSSMYCCSKAALSMLTKCQAVEFGPHDVRVNSIRPTLMATGLVKNPEIFQTLFDAVQKKQIIKKPLETQEVAQLVVFLSSSQAGMITGEEIAIDAGIHLT